MTEKSLLEQINESERLLSKWYVIRYNFSSYYNPTWRTSLGDATEEELQLCFDIFRAILNLIKNDSYQLFNNYFISTSSSKEDFISSVKCHYSKSLKFEIDGISLLLRCICYERFKRKFRANPKRVNDLIAKEKTFKESIIFNEN